MISSKIFLNFQTKQIIIFTVFDLINAHSLVIAYRVYISSNNIWFLDSTVVQFIINKESRGWKNMWILTSWLHQKPADLDLHWF